MKLSYRDTQRTLNGLRRIDTAEETKLDPEVRLRIGININRLMPVVQLFEKEIQRIQQSAALANGKGFVDQGRMIQAEKELNDLSEHMDDYKLKKFRLEEFKLKENNKIKAETLAQIAPLVRDFDDGSFDED